ncbi:MAG TPA: methyltransferase domain-containing protein [Mycobacteriales bacterium]
MSQHLDEATESGDADRSQATLLELVGPDRRVLDVGCGAGQVARGLLAQGCTVVGIDSDAAAAEKAADALEQVVVAELDTLDLIETFGESSFDVVVYDDVLGELRDPRGSLRQARRLLRPGGSLVTSVHNVGHGDVRLALLSGRWDYAQSGPLDESRLRFYTHDSIRQLLRACGFAVVDTRRIDRAMFDTGLGVTPQDYPPELVEAVTTAPDSQTYRFVLRAVLDDADGAVMLLSDREHAAAVAVDSLRRRVGELEQTLAVTEDRLARAEAERDIRAASAEHADRELAAFRATRTYRWSRRARRIYGEFRAGRQ